MQAFLVPEQEVSAIANPLFKKCIVVILAGYKLEVGLVFVFTRVHELWEGILIVGGPILSLLEGYADVLACGSVYQVSSIHGKEGLGETWPGRH